MDVDFWSSRLQSAKQVIALQASRLSSDNHLLLDDFEGDEDARAYFPCPFCYVEIEVNLLCSHLQIEHCFDLKNAVCPLCAANLGKDATGHFTAQHTSSLKRRRKSQKSSPGNVTSATVGKDPGSLLWSSATNGENQIEISPDPLLSPFICGIPVLGPEKIQQEETPRKDSAVAPDSKSALPPSSDENQGQDYDMRMQRAEFVQQLIGSTIF